jgi:hypothetical protein
MHRRDFVAGVAASLLGSRAAAAPQPGWKTWRGGRRLDSLHAETFRYELTATALP